MKKTTIMNVAILSVLIACAILPFAGCDTGSSNDTAATSNDTTDTTGSTGTTDTTGTTGSTGATTDTTGATTDTTGTTTDTTGTTTDTTGTTTDTTGTTTDTTGTTTDTTGTTTDTTTPACKLDFESANIASMIAAGGFTAEVGDMNATWDDNESQGDATSDMAFSADTTAFATGSASLKITATVLQNTYWHPSAQWIAKVEFQKAGLSVPVDLTGKTVSIKARVPAASNITAVKVVFIDSAWKQSQGKEVQVGTKDTWIPVSYAYDKTKPETTDYTDGEFDITKVTGIKIVAVKGGATAASSETLLVDSIDWN